MGTPSDDPRVRPIPIEDDLSASVLSSPSDEGTPITGRPWLPIAVSGLAVAIVVGSVALFGALGEDDPPVLDSTPFADRAGVEDRAGNASPFGEPLNELIPGIEDRLTLIVDSEDGPTTLQWDPEFIRPKEILLDPRPAPDSTHRAVFDSSGRFIAVTEHLPDTLTYNLSLGIPTELETVTLPAVLSHTWHATEVGRLAWVQQMADESSMLFTAAVDPMGRSLMHISAVTPIDEGEQLVRWDANGFLSTTPRQTTLWRSGDGSLLRSRPGTVAAVSATSLVMAPPHVAPDHLTEAVLMTRMGDDPETLFDRRVMEDDGVASVAMSANTDLLANFRGGLSDAHLEVHGPTVNPTRHLTYRGALTPVGFTANDRFVVLRVDGTNDLVFADWMAGSFHLLDVPEGYTVLAFDIG
ncbi:MAG: hypothetical protein R2823_06835 [Acidimicrobiia bacterium]